MDSCKRCNLPHKFTETCLNCGEPRRVEIGTPFALPLGQGEQEPPFSVAFCVVELLEPQTGTAVVHFDSGRARGRLPLRTVREGMVFLERYTEEAAA